MLFDGDSALKRLPQDTPTEEVMYLDAMRYAAEMVELSYLRLCDGLSRISCEDDEQKHRLLSVQVLQDAWSIIDSADRLRALICRATIFNKDDGEALSANMSCVRLLRNTVQHLDGKIPHLASKEWPVWGVLRWFEWTVPPHIGRSCLLMAGSRATRRPEVAQEPKSGDFSPGISEVVLASNGIEVSLRSVRENIALIAEALEQGASEEHPQDEQGKTFAADLFICANFDFRRQS